MQKGKTIFLLGAKDPEMDAMELILRVRFQPNEVLYAMLNGKRVSPAEAYDADLVPGLEVGDTLVRIECAPIAVPENVKVIVIDHHRIGDPGYSLGPEKFWEAASIGQLIRHLGLSHTLEERIIAAMDHCFPAAIRGECPGVSREDVIEFKVRSIAEGTRSHHDDVRKKIDFYTGFIMGAKVTSIGKQLVKDLRAKNFGEGYSLDFLTMQVAVSIDGSAALILHREVKNGPERIQITGNAHPKTVEHFMTIWAPAQGLIRIYGVPDRGYAGGYLP